MGPEIRRCMGEIAYGDYQSHNQRLDVGDFRGAQLSGCNLSAVFWEGAKLDGAKLAGANLFSAYLKDATGLTDDQIRRSRNRRFAELPPEMMKRLHGFGISQNYSGLNLGAVDWQFALLTGLKFRSSDLSRGWWESRASLHSISRWIPTQGACRIAESSMGNESRIHAPVPERPGQRRTSFLDL